MSEITFDPSKLKVVGIDEVRANAWNPKDKDTEEYKQIIESIKKYGQRIPVVVRDNKGFEIIDGEQRWRACKELKFEKVIVYNEGVLDDKQAQELTLWYQVQVPFNEISLAKMIADLTTKYTDAFVPYPPEKIEEMKKLLKFDWNQFEANKLPSLQNPSAMKILNIVLTEEQYNVVQQAMDKVRKEAETPDLTDGRIIELICIEFINMPEGTTGLNQP